MSKKGMGIIIGAPYASGILATGISKEARYNFAAVEESILKRVDVIERIGSFHQLPLKAAALQFPLGHSMVASIIPGANQPGHVLDTLEMMKHPKPDDYWGDLKNEGLLHPEASIPVSG